MEAPMQSSKHFNAGSLIALMLALAVVLTSCGGTPAAAPTAAPEATSAPAAAQPTSAPAAAEPTSAPAAAQPTSAPEATSASAATAAPAGGGSGQFAGVEITAVTFTGPQIAEPLQRHANEFAQQTGAK